MARRIAVPIRTVTEGCIAVASMLLFSGASTVWAGQAATLKIGSETLQYRVPRGFCIPNGGNADVAAGLADLDTRNLTLAAYLDCKQAKAANQGETYPDRTIEIKTPYRGLNARVPQGRSSFVREMVAAMPEVTGKLSDALPNEHDRLRRYLDGLGIDQQAFQAGQPHFLGVIGEDEDAVYCALLSSAKVEGESFLFGTVYSMTLLKGKVVSFYLTDKYEGEATMSALHDFVRKQTGILVDLNS